MYVLTEGHFIDDDNAPCLSYGIKCTENNVCIPDITTDREKLLSFIHLLNREGLQPVHLMDVVEDFLAC